MTSSPDRPRVRTGGPVRLLLALIACSVVLGSAGPVWAEEARWSTWDTLNAIEQYSAEFDVSYAWLYATVGCETGWTFNPYSVGRQGELGAAQLHPRGELRRFRAWGYDDPFSPYQSVRFMAQRFTMGGARAWSCA